MSSLNANCNRDSHFIFKCVFVCSKTDQAFLLGMTGNHGNIKHIKKNKDLPFSVFKNRVGLSYTWNNIDF